jgi:hypothetical protein
VRARELVAVTVALCALGSAPDLTGAAKPAHCASVRTNRFMHLDAHGLFGAYSLTAAGTSCATARTVASRYVRDPYAVDSPKHPTTKILGWSCRWRSPAKPVSQQVAVTCAESSARIGFADKLPNG